MIVSRESRKKILQENYDIIDDLGLDPVFIKKLDFDTDSVRTVEETLSHDEYRNRD